MTEHVSNVEDIISRYSETEAELDYLRMKLQDKINQKRAEMDQRRSMAESAAGSDDDASPSPATGRHVTFARLFVKDKNMKLGDRSMRELAEIRELEETITAKSTYLRDLLMATEFLRRALPRDFFYKACLNFRARYLLSQGIRQGIAHFAGAESSYYKPKYKMKERIVSNQDCCSLYRTNRPYRVMEARFDVS
eukprot:scaffold15817_cov30-Prasinocladus_malaysianus.AAC.2